MEWNSGWYRVWPLGLFPIWGAMMVMMVMIVDDDGAPNVDVVAFYWIVNCESIFLNMFEMQLLITKPPLMIPPWLNLRELGDYAGIFNYFQQPICCWRRDVLLAEMDRHGSFTVHSYVFLFLKNVWFLFHASFIIFPYTPPFWIQAASGPVLGGLFRQRQSLLCGSVLLFRAEPGSKFRWWWAYIEAPPKKRCKVNNSYWKWKNGGKYDDKCHSLSLTWYS